MQPTSSSSVISSKSIRLAGENINLSDSTNSCLNNTSFSSAAQHQPLLNISNRVNAITISSFNKERQNFGDSLTCLEKIVVLRANILQTTLQRYQDSHILNKKLAVSFIREIGEDLDDVTRVFFALFCFALHCFYILLMRINLGYSVNYLAPHYPSKINTIKVTLSS